jgi:hypothetical protein
MKDEVLRATSKSASEAREEDTEEGPMWRDMRQIAMLTAVLALGAPTIGEAQSSDPKSDTYTWSGEFVSVDTAGMTMTVKSRVAYEEALSELKQLKPGERVWVVWSGVHDYSDAVRQVRRVEVHRKIDENLVLPAELASAEAPNQYITIRVRIPQSSLSDVKAVKPGAWVTVRSRHRPATDAEAVIAVTPYGTNTTTK